jgi:hypothetical protein
MKLAIALLLIALPAFAGSTSITTTAKQDSILAQLAAEKNETVTQYMTDAIGDRVKSEYGTLIGRTVGTQLANQWDTLTTTQKTAICSTLAIAACPP